jgi:hypothetical protein
MTMRAIIVDDEELARRGIRALLKLNPALHLHWAAGRGNSVEAYLLNKSHLLIRRRRHATPGFGHAH